MNLNSASLKNFDIPTRAMKCLNDKLPAELHFCLLYKDDGMRRSPKNFKGPYADKLSNYYSVLLHNNLIIGIHKDKSAGIKEYSFQFLKI